MYRRSALWSLLALLTLVLFWWAADIGHIEKTDNAYVRQRSVQVSPRVSGHIVRVIARDYQHVDAGELLYTIDTADAELRLRQAEAQLEQSRRALVKYAAARAYSAARRAVSQAAASAAEAEAELARIEERRFAELLRKKMSSQGDYDRARSTLMEKAAALREKRAEIDTHDAELALIDAEESRERMLVEEREAARALLAKQIADAEVRAPRAGRLGPVDLDPGEWVSAGATSLKLFASEGAWIETNFKETQIASIQPGTPARIRIDALPDIEFAGVVAGLSPGSGAEFSLLPAENATGNFTKIVQRIPVRICVRGDDETLARLRSGMSAIVYVDDRLEADKAPATDCMG